MTALVGGSGVQAVAEQASNIPGVSKASWEGCKGTSAPVAVFIKQVVRSPQRPSITIGQQG